MVDWGLYCTYCVEKPLHISDVEENDAEHEKAVDNDTHNNSCHKQLSKEENKDRKKQFKAAQAENRTKKLPKHMKKARDKRSKK